MPRISIASTRLAPIFVALDDATDTLALLRFLDPEDPDADAAAVIEHLQLRRGPTPSRPRACAPVVAQVRRYVAGTARTLDVPTATRGTPFQQLVWRTVSRIPYGRTLSYRELAAKVERPTAWRAVARANATNPTALVVPCHRVLGSDGRATGYAGGIAVKEALLELERRHAE